MLPLIQPCMKRTRKLHNSKNMPAAYPPRTYWDSSPHRRSQGVQWVHLHPPQGGEIFFRPNLQEKCVSAPPQDTKCTPSQNKSQFLGVFAWWLKFGGIII